MNFPSTTVITVFAVWGLCVGANTANAATLADFQKAVGSGGCDSIPYDSLRQNCEGTQRAVDNDCTKKYSCDEFDPQGVQVNIENVQKKIADLNAKRSDLAKLRDELKSKLSAASDDSEKRSLEDQIKRTEYEDESAKNEIYEYNKKTDDWKRQLDNERKEINDRIYYGKRCVSARAEMQKIFGQAYYNAEHESEPSITAEADKLLPRWAEGQKSHGDELGRVQTAVEKCIRML